MKKERKSYNTTLRKDLLKELRILTAHYDDKKQNDFIEEALVDLFKKYKKRSLGDLFKKYKNLSKK